MSIDFQTIVQDQDYPFVNQSPEEVLEIANAIAASETKLFDEIVAITDPSIDNVLKPFATHYNENSFPEGQSTFINMYPLVKNYVMHRQRGRNHRQQFN